jgi:hypothetical protein
MYFQPQEGSAVTSLAEAVSHNNTIKAFENANSNCSMLQWFLNVLKDSFIYVDEKKEYIKGSQKDIERQQALNKKSIAKEQLVAAKHERKDIPGYKWITKHTFCATAIDYEGYEYERDYVCYLRVTQNTNFSNCYVPLDEFITGTIQHLDSCQSEISAYRLAERIGVKYKDIASLFDIYKLEHWTIGFSTNETRYNGKKYKDSDILLLLEQYKVAVTLEYNNNDEVVNYPRYTPYADFLESPLEVIPEDPNKYAMQA